MSVSVFPGVKGDRAPPTKMNGPPAPTGEPFNVIAPPASTPTNRDGSMMSVLRSNKAKDSDPPKQPPRLPQRWAIILAVSAGDAFAIGSTAGPAMGVSNGVALAMLLHTMLE